MSSVEMRTATRPTAVTINEPISQAIPPKKEANIVAIEPIRLDSPKQRTSTIWSN